MSNEGLFEPGDLIFAYTRKQAIEDGVLVDVSLQAHEAGFRYHTVLTEAAWNEAVAWDPGAGSEQDEKGRLWDVLMMARHAIRRAPPNTDRAEFKLSVLEPNGSRKVVSMWVHIGPGDTPDPVFTIMLIGED